MIQGIPDDKEFNIHVFNKTIWYRGYNIHRWDGPAIIYNNPDIRDQYYLFGKRYKSKEWWERAKQNDKILWKLII